MHTSIALHVLRLALSFFTLEFLPVSVEVSVSPSTNHRRGRRGREARERVGHPHAQDPRWRRQAREKSGCGRHVGVSPVRAPSALPLVALYRLLQVVGIRQVYLQTFHGIKVFGVPERRGEALKHVQNSRISLSISFSLCSEREGGRGDRGGEPQALDDLLPQLLVDDFDEASSSND